MSKRFSGPNSESPTLKVSLDSNDQAKDCPFRNVLDKIGDKWGVSVFTVLEDGPKRFNQLRRLVGKISHRVLAQTARPGARWLRVAYSPSRTASQSRVRDHSARSLPTYICQTVHGLDERRLPGHSAGS